MAVDNGEGNEPGEVAGKFAQDQTSERGDGDGRYGGITRFGGMTFGGSYPFGREGMTFGAGFAPDLPDWRDKVLIPPLYELRDEPGATPVYQLGDKLTPREIEDHNHRLVPELAGPSYLLLAEQWRKTVPVYEQKPYESCVSCAIASVIRYLAKATGVNADLDPSRLFLYYNARALEGTESSDPPVGTGIRSAIKGLNRYGVCDEQSWPYPDSESPQPTIPRQPPEDAYRRTHYKDGVEYHRIFRLDPRNNIHQLDLGAVRRAISNNIPVICGFTAFASFGKGKTDGVVGLPTEEDNNAVFNTLPKDTVNGAISTISSFGHASVIIGYQDGPEHPADPKEPRNPETGTFTLVNSWGADWGLGGTFTLPAAYLADSSLASDFWAITSLSDIPGETATLQS